MVLDTLSQIWTIDQVLEFSVGLKLVRRINNTAHQGLLPTEINVD